MNFSHFIDFGEIIVHNIDEDNGGTAMGKVEENKKKKKETLLTAAYELFQEKGFSRTTISDIVEKAGLAKGTFYLYFKDKFDLREKLIVHKSAQLFDDAFRELEKKEMSSFEEELLFITDYIIGRFRKQTSLMQFVAKNLSWGVFMDAVSNTELVSAQPFYRHYLGAMEKYGVRCKSPELMIFTIIELVGATSYNCILLERPVSIDTYLPYLRKTILQIIHVYTEDA